MSQVERIFEIHKMLENSRAVPLQRMMEKLEVSRATVKRDLEYMRDRLQAPILYDRELRGYRYAPEATGGGEGALPYQLPGVWLTSEEMHALLLLRDFVEQLDSRVLAEALQPALKKIETLIQAGKVKPKDLRRRFRMIAARHRPVDDQYFRIASTAVLKRKRLQLKYFSRYSGEIVDREVSPQRLIWYNANWYLDAWCHLRNDFRSFSLDAIKGATMLEAKADDYPQEVLDQRLGAGYGIFAGAPDKMAVLRFRLPASRWIEREEWHRDQQMERLSGNEVRIRVPYSDASELVQDILRYVPHVVVEEPESLRQTVLRQLEAGLAAYGAEVRKPAAGEARYTAG